MAMPIVVDDLEKSLTQGAYDRAKGLFREVCRDAGVAEGQVGFFGTINTPGVSDLDALVIGTPSQLRNVSRTLERLRRSDHELREIFWHPPVYVLESVRRWAGMLHTLYGLSGELRDELRSVGHRSVTDVAYTQTLEHVWFSFLISVLSASFVERQISLRLSLLLHKNFEASLVNFARRTPSRMDHLSESRELRRHIMSGGDPRDALVALKEIADESLTLQDEIADWPYQLSISHFHPIRLSSKVLATKGRSSRLVLKPGVGGLAFLNAGAYEPILRVKKSGGTHQDPLSEYLSTSVMVASEYRRVGLPYPFITPGGVGLPKLVDAT